MTVQQVNAALDLTTQLLGIVVIVSPNSNPLLQYTINVSINNAGGVSAGGAPITQSV